MAVDRPDIIKAQLFKQGAASHDIAGQMFGPPRRLLDRLRENLGHALRHMTKAAILLGRDQPRQMRAHRADRRRNRHIVVVQNDDQPAFGRAGIVHRLIGHARAHRPVADHRDDLVVAALQIARHRHAEAGGDRGRAVRRAERVVFALAAFGESGQAAARAQRADAVAPAGQNLMRIGLVADIPDQTVARRVEDVMQSDRQFDDTQTRA